MQSNAPNLTLGRSTPSVIRIPPLNSTFSSLGMNYSNSMSSPTDYKHTYCSSADYFPDNNKIGRNSYEYDQPMVYSHSFYSQVQPAAPKLYNVRHDSRYSSNQRYEDNFQRYNTSSSRASSATMNWLLDNYETAEGVSLPRCTLYAHYKTYCGEMHHPPMNQASFGKLIRSVFPNLRTRRLGTRGNSKYHYYGIKIKMESKFNQLMKEDFPSHRKQQTFKILTQPTPKDSFPKQVILYGKNEKSFSNEPTVRKPLVVAAEIPTFNKINVSKITVRIKNLAEITNIFQEMYRKHCSQIKDSVVQFNFNMIPSLWKEFLLSQKRIPADQFHQLLDCDEVIEYVFEADCLFYQHLVSVLVPDVLQGGNTSQVQNIRSFAKSLEQQLGGVLCSYEYNKKFVSLKLEAASGFAQTLRRHTKLQHLAQSTRGVLDDPTQLKSMSSDISKVDLGEIKDQMIWISRCKGDFIQRTQDDFIMGLSKFTKIEQWTLWLEDVVSLVLSPHTSVSAFEEAAQQLLLKWSLYMSMVIRDITLRSCITFGSFHLMRLFFDDYIQYLVENKVAQFRSTTLIRMIAENKRKGSKVGEKDTNHGLEEKATNNTIKIT